MYTKLNFASSMFSKMQLHYFEVSLGGRLVYRRITSKKQIPRCLDHM